MDKIQMADLTSQYRRIETEVESALHEVLKSGQYINGEAVGAFAGELAAFTGSKYIVPCANGTDALQIALMALNLKEGDEVILPAFTYAAAVEAAVLLKLKPVLVDIDRKTGNIDPEKIPEALSPRTRVILPVHLFGQSCPMEPILEITRKSCIYVVEDNAQSIGAVYTFGDKSSKQTGTMGTIGTLSFFPTKNLACCGDGGALMTQDEELAKKMKMISLHGQSAKYHHQLIGCNSRLDTIQAAILRVKLKYLDEYIRRRRKAAERYRAGLESLSGIELPACLPESTHVYHQFAIRVKENKRDQLKEYLHEKGIPTIIYYPLPIHKQPAYQGLFRIGSNLHNSEVLCREVLSLPMHTELEDDQLEYIVSGIREFFG